MSGCDECDRVDPNQPFASAECRIERLMKEMGIASYQVAVAKDGEIIYEKAFGFANKELRIPTTVESMYLVASIDKPFVTTALMILAQRGKIDLRAPANAYLDESKLTAYQGDADSATIARLLLHTTGLPYGYYIAGDQINDADKRTNADLVDLAGVLVCPPGSRYQYTNIGYGIFDDILRNAVGEDIKMYITREIITKLGLENTKYFDTIPPPQLIVTQNVEEGVLPVAFDKDGYTALYSTAGDLARFGLLHLKSYHHVAEPILPDSLLDMMWQYHEPQLKTTTRRLGWDVQTDFGLKTVQHGGGGPGIHNWLYLIPSRGLAIAILSNAWYSSPKSTPVLAALISAALSDKERGDFDPEAGRGWPRWPRLNPADYSGLWKGLIKGPKGECALSAKFDSGGRLQIRIDGDSCSGQQWLSPTRDVGKSNGSLLWRFDACIPYLYPFAVHDEVILTVWPQGSELVGHAAAAKEKDFGRGENYVLPQFLRLSRSQP